jgi:streptomycin 6-kinase
MSQAERSIERIRLADGTPAYRKRVPTWAPELAAAEWFSGHGAVRVLEIDRERGVVLMEVAEPGTQLVTLLPEREEEATAAAAAVMRALWRPPPADHAFPCVRDWGRRSLSGRAAGLFAELCDSSGEEVVLHGDLHHFNVLLSGDGWLAIDPKGVVGERAYEPGALLRNPWPGLLDEPDPTALLRRRSAALAEALDLDLERVRAWAYVQALLAAAWCVEDGFDPAFPLAVAERLEPLTRPRIGGPRPPR